MNQKVRMLAGELYTPFGDEALQADYKKCKRLLRLFNATTEEETQKREQILTELLGAAGENPHIEPPFYCDYGCNVLSGKIFMPIMTVLSLTRIKLLSETMFCWGRGFVFLPRSIRLIRMSGG